MVSSLSLVKVDNSLSTSINWSLPAPQTEHIFGTVSASKISPHITHFHSLRPEPCEVLFLLVSLLIFFELSKGTNSLIPSKISPNLTPKSNISLISLSEGLKLIFRLGPTNYMSNSFSLFSILGIASPLQP